MTPLEARPAYPRLRCGWSIVAGLSGVALVVWWVYPLVHARGVYGGHYRVLDIELGAAAALAWVGLALVAATPERRRRWVGIRVATAVSTALMTLALCDLVYACGSMMIGGRGLLALRSSATIADPELRWKHPPGLVWHGRKTPFCRYIDFQTDENGFRNPAGIRQADLVFVGDSVTEAGEVRDEQTFVRGTAAALGRSAVNLGVFSYGPQQELAVLKRYGLAYHPRTVVWQVTEWNDLADAARYRNRQPPPMPSQTWSALYQMHSPLVSLIRAVFPPRAPFVVDFRQTDGAIDRRTVRPYCNFIDGQDVGWAELRAALAKAHDVCRERGIGFVVLYVPDHTRVLAPYVVAHDPAEARQYCPPGGLDRPEDLAHALAAFCRELGCPFIDATARLRHRAARGNRHVYVKNDTHLDVDGHDELVSALVAHFASTDALASDSKVRSAK